MFLGFEVQANDHLLSPSLCPSSLPSSQLLHASPVLDAGRDRPYSASSLIDCFDSKLEKCGNKHKFNSLRFKMCFYRGYLHCLTHPKDIDAAIDASAWMCMDSSFPGSTDPLTLSGATCLLDCYEEHIKKH